MGLFTKKKNTDEKQIKEAVVVEEGAKSEKISSKKATKKKVEENGKKIASSVVASEEAYKFIVSPWITEKTQELMADGKYVFKIRKKVTKRQVKLAIEKMYGVKVVKVNVINIPQKKRTFGKIVGKKASIRKAIVFLAKGDKIEIFK